MPPAVVTPTGIHGRGFLPDEALLAGSGDGFARSRIAALAAMAFKVVAEAGFEPARTFWVLRAYETPELGLYSIPR